MLRTSYDKRIKLLQDKKKISGSELLELKMMMIKLVQGHLKGTYSDEIFKDQKVQLEDKILTKEPMKYQTTDRNRYLLVQYSPPD